MAVTVRIMQTHKKSCKDIIHSLVLLKLEGAKVIVGRVTVSLGKNFTRLARVRDMDS